MELSEVKAVVTGAARGLGREFALQLARAGARVVAGDINNAGLRKLKAQAESLAGQLGVAPLDVAEEPSVVRFVQEAAGQLDGLNVLVNNAGILRDGLLLTREGESIRKLPTNLWSKVLDVNLTGQFLMAREAAAKMIETGARPAVIVNISSLARGGNAGQSNYSAAKAGLDACTRTWALELAEHGIRVGSVAPGLIETPIVEDIAPEALRYLLTGIPLGRMGEPGEVWQAVRFIIECEFFSGRCVEVDGGAAMN